MPIISGGGGGGVPTTGGTITGPTTISPSNKDGVGLALKPVTGATADQTDQWEVYDDVGNLLAYLDAAGNFQVQAAGSVDEILFQGGLWFVRRGSCTYTFSANGSVTVLSAGKAAIIQGAAAVFTVNYDGTVIAPSLPAVDPHVVGSLYSVAGTLHVSAG